MERDPLPPSPGRPLAVSLTVAAGVAAAVLRLVPHPANCSPVGAMALFGGGRLRAWQAFALPLGLMVATDVILMALVGDLTYFFHPSRLSVYSSFALYAVIGRWLLRGRESLPWTLAAAALGSLQFFLLTNFYEWLVQPLHLANFPAHLHYARDLAGLLHCYAAALPFYQVEGALDLHAFVVGDIRYAVLGQLLGDLTFSALLFGAHAWLSRAAFPAERVPALIEPAHG